MLIHSCRRHASLRSRSAQAAAAAGAARAAHRPAGVSGLELVEPGHLRRAGRRPFGQLIDWISGRTPTNPTAVRRLHPDFGPPPYGIPVRGRGRRSGARAGDVRIRRRERHRRAGAAGLSDSRRSAHDSELHRGRRSRAAARRAIGICSSIDRDRWLLYETFATPWNATAVGWEAGSGAVFDLRRNDRRPEGWTSADAAGLAILPGLVRYDEVSAPARSPTRSA